MKPGIEHTAILSYFNAKMRPHEILSELIDNALDYRATRIRIEISPSRLEVCDNGLGISNIENMLRIGASGSHSDPHAIGKYGVGAKHALLAVGKRFDIATKVNGKAIEVQADWGEYAKRGFKEIPDPKPVDPVYLSKMNKHNIACGWSTSVAVYGIHKNRSRTFARFDKTANALSLRYRPALKDGVEIKAIVNSKEYNLADQRFADPPISNVMHATFEVNGKSVSVRAGVADKHYPGMTGCLLVSYGYRVIEKPKDVDGSNLPNQLYAEVNLSTGWRDSLSTHKDEVLADHDELMTAVRDAITPLIELLKQAEQEHRFELVCEGINRNIVEAFKQIRLEGEKRIKKHSGGRQLIISADDKPGGPGRGPKENPERPIIQEGKVEKGNNEIKKITAEQQVRGVINFAVLAQKDLGLHCLVKANIDPGIGLMMISVHLNVSTHIVKKAFDENSDALLVMVAHALSEHFASISREDTAEMLFPGVLDSVTGDADRSYETRAAVLASAIISNLSSLDKMDKNEIKVY